MEGAPRRQSVVANCGTPFVVSGKPLPAKLWIAIKLYYGLIYDEGVVNANGMAKEDETPQISQFVCTHNNYELNRLSHRNNY